MNNHFRISLADDRRLVLVDGLSYVKDVNTLRYVVPYLDQKTLAQAACKTIVELAHSRMLREPNMAEFQRALDRVIGLCNDKGLIERAKNYKQGFLSKQKMGEMGKLRPPCMK